MDSDQLQERLRASRRVRSVAIVAMQRLASEILDVELSPEDAESLVASGDLPGALRDLRERLKTRRTGLSDDEQTSLAAHEVGLRLLGRSEDEIRKVVETTIQTAEARRGAEQELTEELGRLDALISRYEHDSTRLRQFHRRARRLWSRQAKQIATLAEDTAAKDAGIAELERVYARHFEEALHLITARSNA